MNRRKRFWKEKKFSSIKKKKKGSGRTMLDGLANGAYSQALSHYRLARDILPAAFQPWAGSVLIMQPGRRGLLPRTHIDAKLSADARST